MFVEVANTLALSYVGTECAIRGLPSVSWKPLLPVAALNLVSWAAGHLGAAGLDEWLTAGHPLEAAAAAAVVLGIVAICLLAPAPRSSGCLPWPGLWREALARSKASLPRWWSAGSAATFLACGVVCALVSGSAVAERLERASFPPALRRVLLATVAYPLACYLDLLRTSSSLRFRDFLSLIPRALLVTVGLFPLLLIGIGAIFLALCSVLEHTGVDPHVINWPIYYGVLYGPFAGFYFDIKRRFLGKSDPSELPL